MVYVVTTSDESNNLEVDTDLKATIEQNKRVQARPKHKGFSLQGSTVCIMKTALRKAVPVTDPTALQRTPTATTTHPHRSQPVYVYWALPAHQICCDLYLAKLMPACLVLP